MKNDLKIHWDTAYKNSEIDKLGWYEESPDSSLSLIDKCNLDHNATLLNVGAGATTLVDELLIRGYQNIIANDLSPTALDRLASRLNMDDRRKVRWIVDDLTKPCELNNLDTVDLWHDRAVLHFFNTKEEQDTYFTLLMKLVKVKGFVIIATFNLSGATKCSGLPVHRFDKNMLQERLGDNFELIEAFDYTYIMPSGDPRKYVYTLFQRRN